ncbi:MAG: Calx-beta domain-containing protein [Synechococcaceae cyanobacterium]|nr:Calx-beta domain-containing protein [Synechococcaceae cyanobacterium]
MPESALLDPAWQLLRRRASDPGFLALLAEVFGAEATAATALQQRILSGSFLGLTVRLLEAPAMAGALGAYSAGGADFGPTLFLNAALLAPGQDPSLLQRVALEEIGHHLDQLLNGSRDTAGDEGALFASRLLGDALSTAELAALRQENDAGFVQVDGRLIAVENAASAISSSVAAGTTLNVSTASSSLFAYTVTVNSTANNGADLLVAAYSTVSGALIGWQVVNRATNLQGKSYTGSFNFAAAGLSRVDATTITLRAWQGTAGSGYGTGSNNRPVLTYGNASSLSGAQSGFNPNSLTTPGVASSLTLATPLSTPPSGYVQQAFNVSVDSLAPTQAVTISAVSDDQGLITGPVARGGRTDDPSLQLAGTLGGATAGASLGVGEVLRIQDGSTVLGSATLSVVPGGQSTWTFVDSRTLSNGQVVSYTARVVDPGGNLGPVSTAYSVTVDRVAPTLTATVTAISDDVGPIQGTVSNGGRTDDTLLTVRGSLSGSLAAGDTVRIHDGATFLGTATVSGTTWTFNDLRSLVNNQLVSYTARVADLAGNQGVAAAAYAATVDTAAASVTGVALSAASGAVNGLLNAGDTVTATVSFSETVLVSGTPSLALRLNGSLVQAAYSGGSGSSVLSFRATIQAGQSDADGLSIDAGSLLLNGGTIRDRAGLDADLSHGAVAADPAFRVDALAPDAPLLQLGGGVSGGATAAEATQVGGVVTLTAEAGSAVLVSFSGAGGGLLSRSLTATGSPQAIQLSAGDLAVLGEGTVQVTATATDPAGNASAAATTSFLLDTLAPVFSSPAAVAVAENLPVGSPVHTAVAVDAGGPLTYGLSGADAAFFSLNPLSGVLTLLISPDHEARASYSVLLTAADGAGQVSSQALTIAITDVNEFSNLTLSNLADASVAENAAYSSGAPGLSGAIGAVLWTLEGEDAALFSVDAASGVVSMVARDFENPLDSDADNAYRFTLRATDSDGNTAAQAVVVSVTNVDEAGAGPSLQSHNLQAAGDFEIGQNLQLVFSAPVVAGSGVLAIHRGDGELVERFNLATSNRVSFSGNTLTINPTWELQSSSDHYVRIEAGAVRDGNGNAFAGIGDDVSLRFRTGVETWNGDAEEFTLDAFPGTSSEAIGDHRMIFLRTTYADQLNTPWSESTWLDDMSGLDSFWARNSYGKMHVTTTFTPLITLQQTTAWMRDLDTGDGFAGFGTDRGNNNAAPWNYSINLAQQLGYVRANYQGVAVGNNDWTRYGSSWGGGDFIFNGWTGMSLMAHEGGHEIGLGHANWLDPAGAVSEYGNIFDVMGNGGGASDHYGLFAKLSKGWLESSRVVSNPGSGFYRIDAHDLGVQHTDHLYGLLITAGGHTYSFEHRATIPDGRIADSLLVVRQSGNALIDATPDTVNVKTDAGIDIGRTWQVPGSDIHVTVLAQGDGTLDVAVQNGPFAGNLAPSASFTASASQVKASDTVSFSATAADPNGDGLAYFWWFSDGEVGSGQHFSRRFSQTTAGTVTARLTVSDLRGGSSVLETVLNVGAAATSTPVTVGAVTPPASARPLVSLVALDAFAAEGGDDALLRISRQGTDLSAPLQVHLSYGGSGLNDVSAGSRPASVTLAAGEASLTLPISLPDDSLVEASRALTVSLVSDAAYDISGQNASVNVNLSDDDRAVVSIEAIDPVASESGRDSAAFLISRSGPLTAALKVHYSPFGSAFNGGDVQALNGEITIAAGERSAVLVLQPRDDGYGEATEQLSVLLASFSSAYDVDPDASVATAVILDNDRPQLAVYSYANTAEGGANGQFQIEATGRAGETVVAQYSLSGTATAGLDYGVPSGSAAITIGPDGRGRAVVSLPVLNDNLVEAAEVVRLSLTPSSAYQLDDDRSAALVISDDDSSGPVVMVSAFEDAPREGGTDVSSSQRSGQGRFYIQRSTTTGTLTVNYTLGGSATAGSDYSGLSSGSVTIADGAPGVVLRFTPLEDTLGEGSETVTLSLTPDSTYGLGVVSSASLWLGDNDQAAVRVGFETLQGRIAETQDPLGPVRDVVVRLNAASAAPVSVTAVVSGGTALGDNLDWTFLDPATDTPIATPTLRFAPGETSQRLRLRVNPDRHAETGDWAQITLINPTGATLTSGASQYRLDIDDRPSSGGDEPNRYVRLLAGGSLLREDAGSDPLLMVALDRPAGTTPITLDLQLSGTAAAGSDFTLPISGLTFQPGELSRAIPLTLLQDAVAETVESLRVALVNVSGAILSGPAAHEIVLVDRDAPRVQPVRARVSSGQAAGTLITTASALAAEGRSLSGWEILAGNSLRDGETGPAFSIDADGRLVLSNPASLPLGTTVMQLVVRATDSLGAASDGLVTVEVNGQRVLRETRWSGDAAFTNQDWSGPPIATGLLTSSASASGVGDDYSRRITGLLEPTTSGDYTFWVAGDDHVRLYLGSDENESSRSLIALVDGWTGVQEWTKYPGQQSAVLSLQAGRRYWFEVQQREGGGGDHVQVAWQGPGMASKALIGQANFGTIVPEAPSPSPPAAAAYPAGVAAASFSSTIGTDSGLTPTISGGGSSRDRTLQLSGSVAPGSSVQLFDGTTLLGSASVDGGLWSFTTPPLADGVHTFVAQVRDAVGNLRLTAPLQAQINAELELGPHQLLSHSASPGQLHTSGQISSLDRLLSRGDGLVLFRSADAGQYGNAGVAFSDGNTSTLDLLVVDGRTGVQQLVNRGFSSATSSANKAVTPAGLSPDGRYVVFGSSDVTSFGHNGSAFSDGNTTISGTSDLFVFDRSSSTVKLATWSGSQTHSLSRNASFIGLSADSRTLVLRSDYVQKIGGFTRSGPADTTASADLIAYDLASGAQTLLSHGAASATQSLAAGIGSTVLLSNDGQYALFTANDVSKLGNAGTAFSDTAPSSADLLAARLSDGEIRLLSGAAGVSGGTHVSLLGQSGDGRHAVFSAADATRYGFSDPAPSGTDLFTVEIATGTIRLLNHAAGNPSAATASNPTFLQVTGDYAYFSVADATSLGATGDDHVGKADLYRVNLSSGERQLLSFQQNNPAAAMNGSVVAGSLLVSNDDRYVAFAYNVPAGTGSGGLSFTQGGDGVFLVDTQAGTIRLVNWTGNQSQGSYGFWAGARPKAFTVGNGALIVESSYLSWTGSGLSGSGQTDKGILSYDLASGALAVLTHSPGGGASVQGAATVYRGISPDGQTVLFTAADASRFGNAGVAFSDGAPAADDLFSVSVGSGEIELISGFNGVSQGSAIAFDGLSESGRVLFRSANVNGLASGGGVISDAAPSGSDLIASSLVLLDLDSAGDSSGGAAGSGSDNITLERSYTIRSRVLPNQTVQLLDNGAPVSDGLATADGQGLISWALSGVSTGSHRYSLLDPLEQIPVMIAGRPLASRLDVTVLEASTAAASSPAGGLDPLTGSRLTGGGTTADQRTLAGFRPVAPPAPPSSRSDGLIGRLPSADTLLPPSGEGESLRVDGYRVPASHASEEEIHDSHGHGEEDCALHGAGSHLLQGSAGEEEDGHGHGEEPTLKLQGAGGLTEAWTGSGGLVAAAAEPCLSGWSAESLAAALGGIPAGSGALGGLHAAELQALLRPVAGL